MTRETPWQISYADGSANFYRFSQESAGGEVAFEYSPVTKEMSNTGTYSGGDPHKAQIPASDARIEELWARVERLEADTASHSPSRDKGTGAFTVTTPAGKRDFIIAMGPVLDEMHQFM